MGDEAIQFLPHSDLDCFASLAMTSEILYAASTCTTS
jgi:hypothetical protein